MSARDEGPKNMWSPIPAAVQSFFWDQGCRTLSQYIEVFRANPPKSRTLPSSTTVCSCVRWWLIRFVDSTSDIIRVVASKQCSVLEMWNRLILMSFIYSSINQTPYQKFPAEFVILLRSGQILIIQQQNWSMKGSSEFRIKASGQIMVLWYMIRVDHPVSRDL